MKNIDGTGFWFIGVLLYFMSILVVVLDSKISYNCNQIIANTLECLASYMQLLGFICFYKDRKKTVELGAFLAIILINACGIYFQLKGRPELFALSEAVNNLIPSVIILLYTVRYYKFNNRYNNYVTLVFVFISLVFMARILLLSGSIFLSRPGVEASAWGFFGPIAWIMLLSILVFSQNHMASGQLKEALVENLGNLTAYKESLIETNSQLVMANNDIVEIFADVLDTRISETSDHVIRVSEFTRVILDKLDYDHDDKEIIISSASLHDIGKIGISDRILNICTVYTAEEKKQMEKHTLIGYEILQKSKTQLLKTAAVISLEHHENWDGSGYPMAKKGEEIAFSSRVVSMADAFDALMHARSYKNAWSLSDAVQFIIDNSGIKFDPEIVKILPLCIPEFKVILSSKGRT